MHLLFAIMSETDVGNVSHVEALLSDIIAKSVKEMKPTETFKMITLLEKSKYCDADGKSVCLFLGPTKSGKSTTLNMLLGNPLKVVLEDDPKVAKLNRRIKLIDINGKGEDFPVIGRTAHSQTTIPKLFSISIRGNVYYVWDCPGSGDTRGSTLEIICQWLVTRLFETAKGVKLFSVFSADALLQPNAQEFRSYIKQVQDLFGLNNIGSISQTLIFTKAAKDVSSDDLKESFLYLLYVYFPNSKELHSFYEKSKAIHIKKPGKDEIGHVYTQDHVSSLIETFDTEDFQKVKPRVAVDADAKLFLHRSIPELTVFASETMKDAYKNVYQDKLKNRIDEIFIKQCTEKDFLKLTQQFINAKQESIDTISSDPSIMQAEEILDKIANFVSAIIPEDCILKDSMEVNKRAVKCYNDVVADYIVNKKYFNFLKTHSDNITHKVEFHEIWDNFTHKLEKPEIRALSQNLTYFYKRCKEANDEIMKLHEMENLKAEKKAIEDFKKCLADAQTNFLNEMKTYLTKRLGDSGISRFWNSVYEVIFGESEPSDYPEIEIASMKDAVTTLHKSFSQYIAEKHLWLLADIVQDYWQE